MIAALTLVLTLAAAAAAPTSPAQAPAEAQETAARTGAAAATSPTPADSALRSRVSAVASQLRCPVCQGLSLDDSQSELSREMKDVIRAQLEAGKSEAEVEAYFVSKYGEWILLEPKPEGFNLALYLLPALALLAGAVVVGRVVRRWSGPPEDE